jgi:LysM repeat protein
MPDASIENAIPCILYKVKKGDTLWNIAQRYPGNTPEELAEINAISDYIRIGQTLCVPDKK